MFWAELTAPQATIIAGFITVIGALVAVVFGSWLFSGRVKDLKTALDQSDGLLKSHKVNVENVLEEVKRSVQSLDEQFRTTLESLGQIRGSVGDLESASVETDVTEPQLGAREKLKSDWLAIRDKVEMLAASQKLDGRTRAKYARVDRRQYGELWNVLEKDKVFGSDGQKFKQAVDMWQRFKSGRSTPNNRELEIMNSLRKDLAPQQA